MITIWLKLFSVVQLYNHMVIYNRREFFRVKAIFIYYTWRLEYDVVDEHGITLGDSLYCWTLLASFIHAHAGPGRDLSLRKHR
jgi:hypothetical protein